MARHSSDQRISHADRHQHRRAHVDAQARGIFTQRAYCQAHELAYPSFTYWRLRPQDRREPDSARDDVPAPPRPSSAFVPVSVRCALYRHPIDFRKGYRGLSAVVEWELGHDPISGTLYAFVNRARNKAKILLWEDNGFVLYYKALAEERFCWPGPGERTMALTGEQLNGLLDGYDISTMTPHIVLRYETAC